MTTPVWPTQLNYYIERGSFQLIQNDPALGSEFDYGPARMRRRFTKGIAKHQLTFVFDTEDYEVFKSFWVHSLIQGISWFEVPVWEGSQYVVRRARFVEPVVTTDYAFRHVKVSAKLEVKDMLVFSEGLGQLIGEYGAADLASIANVIDYTVNEHWETTWT